MNRLTEYEVAAFTAFVMHTISMDMRHRLMTEFPAIYNKLVGRPIVASVLLCICGHVPQGCVCDDKDVSADAVGSHPRENGALAT